MGYTDNIHYYLINHKFVVWDTQTDINFNNSRTLNFSLRGGRGGVTRRTRHQPRKKTKPKHSNTVEIISKRNIQNIKLEKNASVTKIFICSS